MPNNDLVEIPMLLLLLARLINRQVEVLRSAQSMTILLLVWSDSKGSQKCGGCHEATDHSCGNGCVPSGRFYSRTDQRFGCGRCAVVPV